MSLSFAEVTMRIPSLLDSVIIILVGLFVECVSALIILAWFVMMSFADLGCHSCGGNLLFIERCTHCKCLHLIFFLMRMSISCS